ncbi:serine/threonine-protein kinase [Streptacidiphilus monticola]
MGGLPVGAAGERVAGYQLEQEIGRGGMAVVYRARDLRLDRTVAVKLLAPGLADNDVFRKRFISESRAAAAIDHPNIIPVFEAGESEGVLFIAMRFVRGRDLRVLLDREGPLGLPQTLRIAAQLASALDAAHSRELVHRDVKPGNVLLAEGTDSDHPEHVYLTDFGLTKRSSSLTGLTAVGQFVGTVDYVAPEQISGRPVDGRCDVYSTACVLFEALCGSPFRRGDDLASLWAHLHDDASSLTERRPELPAGLDEVFARALAKEPDQRHGSCLELVAAVRAAAGEPHDEPRVLHDATQLVRATQLVAAAPLPEPPAWAAPVFAVPRPGEVPR